MSWIRGITAVILGGATIAYASGYDDVLYRTIMSYGASIFVYVMVNVIDLFCFFLDLMPALPYASDYVMGLTSFITVLARANTFFPVAETALMFSFTVGFILVFFTIKIILKLIPTIG